MVVAADEVVDARDLCARRERVPHGNTCAKLLDYIGQVFECKADCPHYSRRCIAGSFFKHRKSLEGHGQGGRHESPVALPPARIET